jgi:type II secretory pathway predicted ATPase ExeA
VSFNYVKRTPSLVDVGGGCHQFQTEALAYESYYGLTEKPFSLNADSRFVYESATYVATRDALLAGIRRREGLLVLTGQIGTGKTTLCRAVLSSLGRNTYASLVPDPFASREDLLKMALIDFGVLSIQELTAGSVRQASRTELGYLLSDFLSKLPRDAFAIVIIDEAQNLTLPLIEETRILSDTFAANGQLQIVFVGQPELHAKLKSPEMRQVDQRVCGYHRLAPMTRDAVAGYIQHRLRAAGGRPGQVLFPPDIIDGLHGRTGGVPRLINRVCDRALMLAHEKRAESVNREILDTALLEVGAATLSPTWDSIMFAETPAPAAPVDTVPATAIAPVEIVEATQVPEATVTTAPPAPEPAAPQAAEVAETAPVEEHFKKEIEHWVEQELAAAVGAVAAPSRKPVTNQTRPVKRTPPPTPAKGRENSRRTEWPRDFRSETYMHRVARLCVKWIGVGLGVFVVLNIGLLAASTVSMMLLPPSMPDRPEAPERIVVSLPALHVPPHDFEILPETIGETPNYGVAVGLFFDGARADAVVDALTKEGLPAMQRPLTLRGQPMQQIMLGPFFTRADALADMQRLKKLGGYDDASVVDISKAP